MMASTTQPVRRHSKLSEIVGNGGEKGASSNSPYSGGAPSRVSIRIPSLLRTRIPLIAVFPFILLGFILSSMRSFDSDADQEAGVQRYYDAQSSGGGSSAEDLSDTSKEAIQNRSKSWKERFLAISDNGSASKAQLDKRLHQDYSVKDGLLYFRPAAQEGSEGIDAAFAGLPTQRHPILYLMENAEKEWEAKLDRQSTTLGQAVEEYKRRHNRPPPAGFDAWYAFSVKNEVQMPDEYDSIVRNLEPFFALPPSVFQERAAKLANEPDFHYSRVSFTMTIKDGQLEVTGPLRFAPRAKELKQLIDGFAEYLPDLHFTVTGHDGPAVVVNGDSKQAHLEAARAGKFLDAEQYDDYADVPDNAGFSGFCPPDSAWRRSLYGFDLAVPSAGSFIIDHEEAADPCKHPSTAWQHGFFLWTGPRAHTLFPLFTSAKTSIHSDILITPLEQYWYPVGDDPEWEEKEHNKLLWRGSTTGVFHGRESRWRSSHRSRLVLMTNELEGTTLVQYADENGGLHAIEEDVVEVNDRYFDVQFSGRPAQCDEGDGTCKAMARTFEFAENMPQSEANNYKYIMDMDGNGWSGRFHRLMSTNSAILKSTIMPEWYQDRVQPWLHYVPVKVDYTDIRDIMAFFVGGPDGQAAHDELGQKIGAQGKKWAQTFWREEDMQAFMYRLLLEYARLLTRTEDDLTKGDYKTDPNR